MPSNLYQEGLKRILSRATGTIDLVADPIKVLFVSITYAPDRDHAFVSDIVSHELTGTGYTGGFGGSGRKALASKVINKDNVRDRAYYDAANPVWTAIDAGEIGGAIVFKEGTSDADSPLICFIDTSNLLTNGDDVTLEFDAEGIFEWLA